ncbi:MAG: hypothetical protein VX334_06980, partial [Pseudomonadota bacterium]|nr:hypothetical protein [Pseudomonadota bacterium]
EVMSTERVGEEVSFVTRILYHSRKEDYLFCCNNMLIIVSSLTATHLLLVQLSYSHIHRHRSVLRL